MVSQDLVSRNPIHFAGNVSKTAPEWHVQARGGNRAGGPDRGPAPIRNSRLECGAGLAEINIRGYLPDYVWAALDDAVPMS